MKYNGTDADGNNNMSLERDNLVPMIPITFGSNNRGCYDKCGPACSVQFSIGVTVTVVTILCSTLGLAIGNRLGAHTMLLVAVFCYVPALAIIILLITPD